MTQLDSLFDRMDAWRHLPNYQLERRADLFFSLYLAEVIEAKLGFPVNGRIVPEFPVRIGTIQQEKPLNRSFKIDYLVLSRSGDTAIFVELKTEEMSRRDDQDRYLIAAQKAGLPVLIEGVLDVFRVTDAKRKYFCLLEYLESLALIGIPEQLRDIMLRPRLQGATKASRQIQITEQVSEILILYVQPTGTGSEVVSFEEFRAVVQTHDDPISRRFAQSLSEWAGVKAGEKQFRYRNERTP